MGGGQFYDCLGMPAPYLGGGAWGIGWCVTQCTHRQEAGGCVDVPPNCRKPVAPSDTLPQGYFMNRGVVVQAVPL